MPRSPFNSDELEVDPDLIDWAKKHRLIDLLKRLFEAGYTTLPVVATLKKEYAFFVVAFVLTKLVTGPLWQLRLLGQGILHVFRLHFESLPRPHQLRDLIRQYNQKKKKQKKQEKKKMKGKRKH